MQLHLACRTVCSGLSLCAPAQDQSASCWGAIRWRVPPYLLSREFMEAAIRSIACPQPPGGVGALLKEREGGPSRASKDVQGRGMSTLCKDVCSLNVSEKRARRHVHARKTSPSPPPAPVSSLPSSIPGAKVAINRQLPLPASRTDSASTLRPGAERPEVSWGSCGALATSSLLR
jgi:hypothetical protein